MFNKVFLIGRLTRDPETRYTPSGIAVSRFTLAVSRTFKSQNGGTEEADFLRIVAWRRLAEICGEYLRKGRLVSIEGKLQISSYERNGETIKSAEIVADNMQILEKRQDTGARPAVSASASSSSQPNIGQETGALNEVPAEEVPF